MSPQPNLALFSDMFSAKGSPPSTADFNHSINYFFLTLIRNPSFLSSILSNSTFISSTWFSPNIFPVTFGTMGSDGGKIVMTTRRGSSISKKNHPIQFSSSSKGSGWSFELHPWSYATSLLIQKSRCSGISGTLKSFGLMGDVGAAVAHYDGWLSCMTESARDFMSWESFSIS